MIGMFVCEKEMIMELFFLLVPKHEIFHMPPIPMYTDNAFLTLAMNFESSKHSLPMTGPTDKIKHLDAKKR